MVGSQSPSVWAHAGHGDANVAEDAAPKVPSKPVAAPQDMSDGTHHPYEQVLTRAFYIPGFMGSSAGPQTERLAIAGYVLGIHPNLIGEGALLLAVGSPFLLYAARRSWS